MMFSLAVQASFYSNVIQCWPVTSWPGFSPWSGYWWLELFYIFNGPFIVFYVVVVNSNLGISMI